MKLSKIVAITVTGLLALSACQPKISFEQAVVTNDVKAVQYYLKHGANANEQDENGVTLLMKAAQAGATDVARVLINAGADVNAIDSNEKMVLFFALEGNIPTIQLLLKSGVNEKNIKQAFLYAALQGKTDVINAFLQAGADANMKDSQETTALMFALSQSNNDTASALIKAGTDVNLKDNTGKTALYFVSLYGTAQVARQLFEAGAKINLPEDNKLLVYASDRPAAEILTLFISNGMDVNTIDNRGVTPLGNASFRGIKENVKALLAAKADPNKKDKWGVAPISYATYISDAEVAKLLLDAGANPNVVDHTGRTPLSIAKERAYALEQELNHEHGEEHAHEHEHANTDGDHVHERHNPAAEIVELLQKAGAKK